MRKPRYGDGLDRRVPRSIGLNGVHREKPPVTAFKHLRDAHAAQTKARARPVSELGPNSGGCVRTGRTARVPGMRRVAGRRGRRRRGEPFNDAVEEWNRLWGFVDLCLREKVAQCAGVRCRTAGLRTRPLRRVVHGTFRLATGGECVVARPQECDEPQKHSQERRDVGTGREWHG